jgi:WD40 repeat protein
MELSIKQEETKRHSDIITGLSWSGTGVLLTVSDDKTVRVWNTEGEPQSKLIDVP